MRFSASAAKSDVKASEFSVHGKPDPRTFHQIRTALLTGGSDPHYTFGLATSLIPEGVCVDVVGSDEMDSPEMREMTGLNFVNLRGNQNPNVSFSRKVTRILQYYGRLMRYAGCAQAQIFHILWNNKFLFFDRTLLMLYYKIRGKKIVLTAHNINDGRRDHRDSLLNRLTLRTQYHLADHIFVHTKKMKDELLKDFGVREEAVTIIPYGINNAVPRTSLTSADAKRRIGVTEREKTILFFGNIRPYKGLEYLVTAFQRLVVSDPDYRLIIAGRLFKGAENYWEGIRQILQKPPVQGKVILKTEFVPDQETELYFNASDVLALPYTDIFQSGILALGYSFGLPVIATDVGSFREYVIEGRTGYVCRPCNPDELADTIEKYFQSELFGNLNQVRQDIKKLAEAQHSWHTVAGLTRNVYTDLLKMTPLGSSWPELPLASPKVQAESRPSPPARDYRGVAVVDDHSR